MTHTTDAPLLVRVGRAEPSPPSPASASRPLSPEADRPLPGGRTVVVCIVAYFVLAVLAYLPVGPFDARALPIAAANNPAGSDPMQMTWFLSWLPYALTHGQSLFHTNFIDYPSGVNLADNTSVPLLGILGWPITATLGPVAAFNFLVRLSFALSAVSMFLVLRRWCRTWQAPFLAGLLYAFGPYTVAQNLHLDLIFIPFPPLFVLLADELVRRQRMRPALTGALIGLVGALQYLVSPDIFSGLCALGILAAIGLGIRFRHEARARIAYVVRAVPFGLVGFGLLAGYPIYEMLLGPGHLHGPVIPVKSLQIDRADLLGPIVPTSNQLVVPTFLSRFGDYFVNGNLSENGSYLGLPLLVLFVVLLRRLRRDATVVTFAWLAFAAFVLSLGSYLVIGTWHSPLPLPEYVFGRLPLLQNTIPARYSLYVLLFASMILGIGLERLAAAPGRVERFAVTPEHFERPDAAPRAGSRPTAAGRLRRWATARPRRGSLAVAGAVIVVSLLPTVPFQSRRLPWPASLPVAMERVVPKGAVVLTYPLATPLATYAMTWQAIGHMNVRLIGGYANIAVPGSRVGQRWPLLLHPHSVEELLGHLPVGDRFPPPPIPSPAVEAQLPAFLNRYSVGAVVAWTTGGDPGTSFVERSIDYFYLRLALGPAQVTGQGYAIWLPARDGWPPPPK